MRCNIFYYLLDQQGNKYKCTSRWWIEWIFARIRLVSLYIVQCTERKVWKEVYWRRDCKLVTLSISVLVFLCMERKKLIMLKWKEPVLFYFYMHSVNLIVKTWSLRSWKLKQAHLTCDFLAQQDGYTNKYSTLPQGVDDCLK